MQSQHELLRPDEQATLVLRRLYERYGYKKFRMNRFEEYDFYAVNRDFLANGQIITFTGLDGKLMALRPDVTLSIVKKTQADAGAADRLYYTEPVYRPCKHASAYRESFQVGVEHIGEITPYASVEVVSLAARSLSLIEADCVLDISHTGYVEGLLAGLPMDDLTRRAVRRCIEEKNAHELRLAVADTLSGEEAARLAAVAQLSGPFPQALPEARALASGEMMLAAIAELETLYAAMAASGEAGPLRLDFSITSDAKYYSGLMLRGYIRGVPSAVLSGGRYDPLLRRMGKPGLSAMGFAIYFDELARFLSAEADTAVETVVLYKPDADPAAVTRMVHSRVARGERVWAGTALPKGLTWSRVLEVNGHA
ncbi:MAG: ATP phosphoribosyltransferase regulatory subunit [Firmicutes bacterium]|nr:ATP phosphoribosyltransferase regulatory subunit [Bacillota bacterium]